MSDLRLEIDGAIATFTLNRPDRLNAIGEPEDGALFTDVCERINGNRRIRCVILTGAGRGFSAGGNVKKMALRDGVFEGGGIKIADNYRDNVHKIVRAIWGIRVPVIAAVNGPAAGLGNDIACLCDIRLCSSSARFGAVFLKLGLIPGDGGSWILPRLIGMARASEMLFSGRMIDAETAFSWGLVSRVFADDELLEAAHKLAGEIAMQAPEALRATKRMLRHAQTVSFEALMEMSASTQALMHLTDDHKEALTAFIEKRSPEYHDR